jgi:hypothetical protein
MQSVIVSHVVKCILIGEANLSLDQSNMLSEVQLKLASSTKGKYRYNTVDCHLFLSNVHHYVVIKKNDTACSNYLNSNPKFEGMPLLLDMISVLDAPLPPFGSFDLTRKFIARILMQLCYYFQFDPKRNSENPYLMF